MTVDEFDRMDGMSCVIGAVHAEWSNGEVILKMPDNSEHDEIEAFASDGFSIVELFRRFVRSKKLGRVYGSHFQIRLPGILSRREPDLSFVTIARLFIDRALIEGPPDSGISRSSPPTALIAIYILKFKEYEAGGNPRTLWLIDPLKRNPERVFLERKGQIPKNCSQTR